jgi:glycosyltransferase involved in cell wall biosynthesis
MEAEIARKIQLRISDINSQGRGGSALTHAQEAKFSIRFVMDNDTMVGGGPRNIYTLSTLLSNSGYDSEVIYFNRVEWPIRSYLEQRGRYTTANYYGAQTRNPPKLFSYVNLFEKIISRRAPASIPSFIVGQEISKPLGLLTYREVPNVYVATAWQTADPTFRIARIRNIRSLYFAQAHEVDFSKDPVVKKYAAKTYSLPMVRFTQSKFLKSYLDEKYGGVTHYIGFGINHSSFYPKDQDKSPLVFTVAREDPNKGFDIFVKAINHLRKKRTDFEVLISGSKVALTRQAISFPFNYLGWIKNDEELATLYRKTIFVNTGIDEALPMPPLEAMACGSAVVITNMRGAMEYAEDGYNCLLCPIGDYVSISESIDRLLSSETLRSSISKNAVSTANKYRWETVLKKFENVLTENTN